MEEEAKKLIIVALALLGIVAFGVGVAVWQTNAADDGDDVGILVQVAHGPVGGGTE